MISYYQWSILRPAVFPIGDTGKMQKKDDWNKKFRKIYTKQNDGSIKGLVEKRETLLMSAKTAGLDTNNLDWEHIQYQNGVVTIQSSFWDESKKMRQIAKIDWESNEVQSFSSRCVGVQQALTMRAIFDHDRVSKMRQRDEQASINPD